MCSVCRVFHEVKHRVTHLGTNRSVRCITSWKQFTSVTIKVGFRLVIVALPDFSFYLFPHKWPIYLFRYISLPHPHPTLLLTTPRSHQYCPSCRPEEGAYAMLSGTPIPATEVRKWWWCHLSSHRCHQMWRLLEFHGVIVAVTYPGTNRHSGSVVERPLCDREVAGSIPRQVIPKTLKMVLAALSLGAQH